ncbi:hypothetical protein Hanom_Chr07g00679551 [Helianthus anomalus]
MGWVMGCQFAMGMDSGSNLTCLNSSSFIGLYVSNRIFMNVVCIKIKYILTFKVLFCF